MRGELSHHLAGLVTSGNRILRADTQDPILLRGVNRSGLEYTEPAAAGFLEAAQLTAGEVREIVLGWRANVLRLPFNQDWALRGRGTFSAEAYLASLDCVIDWAAALGAYTILDLQWLDAQTAYGTTRGPNGEKQTNHVPPTPDAGSITLWQVLAERYRDEPAILFDLFNEPHDPLPDDFLPIHRIGSGGDVVESDADFVGPEDWVAWAERLIAEVRRIRPDGLILVAGVDWAFDLRQVRVDAPNVVYSAHIYPNRKPSLWPRALGGAGQTPVFVGEWGGTDNDLEFGRQLSGLMRQAKLGWTAWSWADYPHLVEPGSAPGYPPTPFGSLVQAELGA